MDKMKRNGEIDFLRFVFAMLIALLHYPNTESFRGGYIGVEFFFLVSGLYLAKHAEKVLSSEKDVDITVETWRYISKRAYYIWKFFLVAIIIRSLQFLIGSVTVREVAYDYLDSIPLLMMLHNVLFKKGRLYLTGNWYISAMIVASFILYFLVLKFREQFTRIVAPIAGILLLGYLMLANDGRINVTNNGGFLISMGLIRAIAEMMLGICLFELSKLLKNYSYSIFLCIVACVIKWLAFVVAILFAIGYLPDDCMMSVVIVLALGILLSYLQIGYCIGANVVTNCLGKLSLLVYLCQGLVLTYSNQLNVFEYIICVIGVSIAIYFLTLLLEKIMLKMIKNNITKN